MKTKLVTSLAAAAALLTLAGQALAADPVALRVIIVETSDLSAYMKEVALIDNLQKKNGAGATIRIWKAKYAGPNAGTIVVSIEYPNLAALAKSDSLTRSNAELSAEMKKLATMRKIVSDSVYEEQTK